MRAAFGAVLGPVAASIVATFLIGCPKDPPPQPTSKTKEWQLLASELPAALLSVSARTPTDVFAVGADKGLGPLVLHFDGKKWEELRTDHRGDLWWVQTFADGRALMSGASGTVLRYDGHGFERMSTPGFAKQIVYGVWGLSADNFYAVGSTAGRNGFIWHYHDHNFDQEPLPSDLTKTAGGDLPGFFKAWGVGDEVWIVGSAGTLLYRKGSAPFTIVRTTTKDPIFTVNGSGGHVLAVGGAGNGVILSVENGAARDVSPAGAGLIQGIFTTDHGDWASGERGLVYSRPDSNTPFAIADHGLTLPAASSLHSIFVDSSGGVWSAGGNVLTSALDNGMLVHFGDAVPPVVVDEDAMPFTVDASATRACPVLVLNAGKNGSIARRWDEQALAAIRRDLPRSMVHARNLFHLSAAMWDAWAGYDAKAKGVFVAERHAADDVDKARRAAISYAAFDVLTHRYQNAVGAATTANCLRAVMTDLGYDPNDAHDTGDDPIAFGNRIAHQIIAKTANDGANEAHDYDDVSFEPLNPALAVDGSGNVLKAPDSWQPLNLSTAISQNGIAIPAGVQRYIGAQWGNVAPFALKRSASGGVQFPDPGPAPKVGPSMKDALVEVIRKTAEADAQSDFGRAISEYWTNGPNHETPPGQWNVLANQVADALLYKTTLFGKGPLVDALNWDVHLYLALNAAEHDAAISAFGIKRQTATPRPISLIRWMATKGQSSDPKAPAYDPDGLPLISGLIEGVTKESSATGQRHAELASFVGQIAVRDWLGEPGDPAQQRGTVGWVRAVDWIPHQRSTFVSPAYPAFVEEESAFAEAAAVVLTGLTGNAHFPDESGTFFAKRDGFLSLEKGPVGDVHLHWSTYADAAVEAGQSQVWAGLQIAQDDLAGRRVGHQVGAAATALATKYFDGTIAP